MSDFLTEALEADLPVERQVTINGKTGGVFFKRISAGQRAQLLKGQRVSTNAGASQVDIDLGENEATKLLMVHFCVCHADGRLFFKSVDEVKKIPAAKASVLYEQAAEVNRETEDVGKP